MQSIVLQAVVKLLISILFMFPFASCRAETAGLPTPTPLTENALVEKTTAITQSPTATAVASENTPTAATSTASLPTAIPSDALSTSTVVPSPTTEPMDWNLKIAYTLRHFSDNQPVTQMWVMDSPDAQPRLLLDFLSVSSLADPHLNWSHDGRFVAFTHLTSESMVTVSTIDITTGAVEQLGFSFPLHPLEPGQSAALDLLDESWSLDDLWLQATLSYIDLETNLVFDREILLDRTGNQVVELDDEIEFVAWSPVVPDQFLYILHPEGDEGYSTVHIGEVNSGEPIASISDLGRYGPGIKYGLSWAPDGKRAVAASFDSATRKTSLVMIDFQQERWQVLYSRKGDDQPLLWSPNGEWIVVGQDGDPALWAINESNQPGDFIPLRTELIKILTWVSDTNWLVYQDGVLIMAINPEATDEPSLIMDLTTIGITSESRVHLSVWSAGN